MSKMCFKSWIIYNLQFIQNFNTVICKNKIILTIFASSMFPNDSTYRSAKMVVACPLSTETNKKTKKYK